MIDLNELIKFNKYDRIKAVKVLREATGINLRDAKSIIDRAYDMKKENPLANANVLLEEPDQVIQAQHVNKVSSANTINPYKQLWYGPIREIWNANHSFILKYQQEVEHEGLHDHKVFISQTRETLDNKVQAQVEKWKIKWEIECEKKQTKELKRASNDEAIIRTTEAEERVAVIENILISSLESKSIVNWDMFKNTEQYIETYPEKPIEPMFKELPIAPEKGDPLYQPNLGLFTSIFSASRIKAIKSAESKYESDYELWKDLVNKATEENKKITTEYEKKMDIYNKEVSKWEKKKKDFQNKQDKYNKVIEEKKIKYGEFDSLAVVEFCSKVLEMANLPDIFQKDFELEYNPENKILIVDYTLPNIELFPKIKEVKYLPSKNELKEVYYTSAFIENMFDNTIYKFILRTLHELFLSDFKDALVAISFNGWISYVNKATGNDEVACIASVQVKKDAFMTINLRNVEPKSCFKSLKGVGSSKLSGITPIQPILSMNREDKRFIGSYNVMQMLDDSINLAAIPWEDFEHLIREIFESEFSSNGGEVKVTQASRDGGVDAVAFDPDPIRGGKIVIQAKRYTNTVGVSAVRDLFGTVMNEGATKGILVTTADYGPDAYEFARNKPITLLNGGNLLHLLEKHGHKAKIDLLEAKTINTANSKKTPLS